MEFKDENYLSEPKFINRKKKKTNKEFIEAYHQKGIEWNIYNTTESKEFINHGRMIMPSSRITDKINNETVLDLLNSTNPFENYIPSFGDILIIEMRYILESIKNITRNPLNGGGYLCFEYKNQNWEESSFIGKNEIKLARKGWVID